MSDAFSKITIEPFSDENSIEELTKLLNKAYKKLSDQGFMYLASYQDSHITKNRIEKGQCFVAFFETKLVATITYYSPAQTSGNDWYDQNFVASYGQFAVDPKFQKLGIGGRLIDLVEKLALSDNAKEITVDTAEGASELISYYSKRGYKFVGHTKWEKTNYRSVLLSKKLTII
ncbi:MAG: GNAT family N-acetyltransferase [Bacteroidia bacterium]